MSAILPLDAPCAKGWVPYALEECSRMENGRAILEELQEAIRSAAPGYRDLTEIFDRYLLSYVVPAGHRAKVVRHLERHWFGEDRSEAFFATEDVAAIYAQGVITTLDLSLRCSGRLPAPITSWWIVDAPAVRMLTFAEAAAVTLLIMTPRPQGTPTTRRFILGDETVAWVSEQSQGKVISRSLNQPETATQPGSNLQVTA